MVGGTGWKNYFRDCDYVCLDTSVLIYLFQDHKKYSNIVDRMFQFFEAKNNHLLSREQFLAPHPAWYAALEGDIDLMRAIADHVYTESRRSVLRFYLYDNPQEDQLRHLFVNDSDYSGAVGSYNLYNDCRFLRVTPN